MSCEPILEVVTMLLPSQISSTFDAICTGTVQCRASGCSGYACRLPDGALPAAGVTRWRSYRCQSTTSASIASFIECIKVFTRRRDGRYCPWLAEAYFSLPCACSKSIVDCRYSIQTRPCLAVPRQTRLPGRSTKRIHLQRSDYAFPLRTSTRACNAEHSTGNYRATSQHWHSESSAAADSARPRVGHQAVERHNLKISFTKGAYYIRPPAIPGSIRRWLTSAHLWSYRPGSKAALHLHWRCKY
ncbi:hypothetical protein MRB53_037647 [Persea americana]|nr:hypothetical protein MRB53_037647 [Persea americana]